MTLTDLRPAASPPNAGMPTQVIALRVPSGLITEAVAACEREGMTLAGIVEKLLNQWVHDRPQLI